MAESVAQAFAELSALLERSAAAHAATIETMASLVHRHAPEWRHPLFRRQWWQCRRRAALRGGVCRALFLTGHADRRAYAAVALGTDIAMLTAASNDLGFEKAYARQVEALVTKRDLLILHSTSGRSPNLLAAARVARARGPTVDRAAGPGRRGPLRELADIALVVDHDDTGRIQLVHMAAQHVIVGMVEADWLGTP